MTESYEDLDGKLDDGDHYDPSVKDDVNDKPPVPKKNKLDVSRLIDNKRIDCSKGIDSN